MLSYDLVRQERHLNLITTLAFLMCNFSTKIPSNFVNVDIDISIILTQGARPLPSDILVVVFCSSMS